MKPIRCNGKLCAALAAILWLSACGHQTTVIRQVCPPTGTDPDCRPQELARIDSNRLATFRIDIEPRGHGSGVVISPHGHLATAYHVVDDAKGLSITMVEPDGQVRTYPAKVVATDKRHDLAIIKIERRFSRVAKLADTKSIRPGNAVYNIGYPHDFGELISRGYVMRLKWSHRFRSGSEVDKCLLVDIKNGPGTSGSGVFSSIDGKLIGLLNMKVWVGSGRAPATVVHVVVPIHYLKALMKKLRQKKPPEPGKPPPEPDKPPLPDKPPPLKKPYQKPDPPK